MNCTDDDKKFLVSIYGYILWKKKRGIKLMDLEENKK